MRLNPTTVQNVVTYNTVIDFSNPDEKLLPGETAYVTIPTGHAQNALADPESGAHFQAVDDAERLQALYKQYNISREASTTHLGGWQVVWKLGPDKKPIDPGSRSKWESPTTTTRNCFRGSPQGDVLVDHGSKEQAPAAERAAARLWWRRATAERVETVDRNGQVRNEVRP